MGDFFLLVLILGPCDLVGGCGCGCGMGQWVMLWLWLCMSYVRVGLQGSGECLPCPEGTSSQGHSGKCFIGDARNEASFCSFYDTTTASYLDNNLQKPLNAFYFDLSALYQQSLIRRFGPVGASLASGAPGGGPQYYLSVCEKQNHHGERCVDAAGQAMDSYACVVSGQNERRKPRRETRPIPSRHKPHRPHAAGRARHTPSVAPVTSHQ